MPRKKSLKIILESIILVLGICYIWNVFPHSMVWAGVKSKVVDATRRVDLREGDFIFQDIHGKLFRVIEGVSGSRLTHCGIIVKKGGELYVLEAIGPVMLTPLNNWIHRGIGSKFKIVRLKEAYQRHIPDIIRAAYRYLDRPYDIQYEWDDEKIYCSELIFKAVDDATGIKLADLKRLGDMNWQPHTAFIRSISGGELPLDRKIMTPGDLALSTKTDFVYSNF
ncbi:MAG: hypothetical protein K8I00_06010, partial [Candidatus Omnitrophica bacterium]|nr:hypothetical protein [Candidatus Omnitrophota bacterium]